MDIKEGYIICENSIKFEILNQTKNEFKDYTFLTLNDLLTNITYNFKKEAITYLNIEKNISYPLIKKYLSYIKYSDLFYDNEKLNSISNIKNELINKNFIEKSMLINHLKNKNVTFIGYFDCFDLRYASKILEANNINYEIIKPETRTNVKREVYSFKTICEESRFVFNKIKELLDKNIDINNIKIANYSDEYEYDFKRLSHYYNIPIEFENKKNILSTPIAISLIENLNNYKNLNDLIDDYKNKYNGNVYLKKIINVINSYKLNNYDIKKTKEIFVNELKKISYDIDKYDNAISLIDFENYDSNLNEYIFYVGFNLGVAPRIKKDDDYLSDEIKKQIGLETSDEENKLNKNKLIYRLNAKSNIIISYKLLTFDNSYLKSLLIDELKYEEIKLPNIFGINESEDLINYGAHLDTYNKFNEENDNFLNSIYDISYLKYDNKFKGLSDEVKKQIINNDVRLSYSSMDKYYKCPFRYYLEKILKVSLNQKDNEANIGSYVHKVLELSNNPDFVLEDAKKQAISIIEKDKNVKFDKKDLFFFKQADDLIDKVLEFNNKHLNQTRLINVLAEENLTYKFNDNLSFIGSIDRLMYVNQDNKNYYAIIDYKTGLIEVNIYNLEDGLHLQLPTYLFLIRNNNENRLKDNELIGLYYNPIKIKNNKPIKLNGFTAAEISKMSYIDTNLSNDIVSSLKPTNDNEFNKNFRGIKSEDEDYLEQLVKDLAIKCYQKIQDGEFDITSILIDGKDESCAFCQMRDICYKKFDNKVFKEKKVFGKEIQDGVE